MTDRPFRVFTRGELREEILSDFRITLREKTNPETGALFTEDEIATATANQSRFWMEADAIDLVLQISQRDGRYLADQVIPTRASTEWLDGYHGPQVGEDRLPATGGAGGATQSAPVGTVFLGSTTIPDATAHYATDPAGLRYQVLYTVVADANGVADLTFKGIDTGEQTNILTGTKLRWANHPVALDEAVTTEDFSGGTADETDADYGKRILDIERHRPGAGNWSQIRTWGRRASNAVEDAFVYCCAYAAGSLHVAITQKRANVTGPLARVPSAGTLASVTSYLTPPSSPVVPDQPHVVVTGCVPQSTDLVLSLDMPLGVSSGWRDVSPWPDISGTTPITIATLADQQNFTVSVSAGSPAVSAPKMMVWDEDESAWEELTVQSVSGAGPSYSVVLTAAPTKTLAVGDVISPANARLELIAETLGAFFDSLGPGELLDTSTSVRGHRASRRPATSEEWPQRAGSGMLSFLRDALGSSLADEDIESVSDDLPDLPVDPVNGPSLLVLGTVGIYPL